MSDVKVTAFPSRPVLTDRLTRRGELLYAAWPGSPFLDLKEGDVLFNWTEDPQSPPKPIVIYPRVRVKTIEDDPVTRLDRDRAGGDPIRVDDLRPLWVPSGSTLQSSGRSCVGVAILGPQPIGSRCETRRHSPRT